VHFRLRVVRAEVVEEMAADEPARAGDEKPHR
jgi:hypothetical protein